MTSYSINIAKAYTMSDWQGLPAHRYHARVHLDDTMKEEQAQAELERLAVAYPWPQYHLTLSMSRQVIETAKMTSTAPAEFLRHHQWRYGSIHKGEEA